MSTPESPGGHNIQLPSTGQEAKKPWYKKLWIWIIVGIVLVIGLISNLVNGGNPTTDEPTEAPAAVAEEVEVTDVVGQDGATARDILMELGLTVEFEGGDDMVLKPSNWTVDSQDPVAGTSTAAGSVVTLTVSKPVPAEEPADPAVLDEITAAQFLAYAWEDRMPYGGSVHYIVDRITTANEDGTFTFKIGATIKNEYGTKVDATIEGDVGGTADAPVILDSILYTKDGQVFDY